MTDKETFILKRIKELEQLADKAISMFCNAYQCEKCPLFDKCDDILNLVNDEIKRLKKMLEENK